MRLVIVKRGQLSTFRFLQKSCTDDPELRVIWDRRRTHERREAAGAMSAERRNQDRRGPAPYSWVAADHVLASRAAEVKAPMPSSILAFHEERPNV